MSVKNIIFNNKKIYKSNFYKSKKLFKIDSLDVNKILVSNKKPYGKKTHLIFSGYNDNGDSGPLCIKLPQMTGYNKYFESNNKAMFLNVIYEKLLK